MYIYKIDRVLRVVDGDTVDVLIDLGFNIKTKQRVRLHGVDAPETRTRDLIEKQQGLQAKQYLEQLFKHANTVTLKSHKIGKYGRVIASLYADGVSVCEHLVREGHAVRHQYK